MQMSLPLVKTVTLKVVIRCEGLRSAPQTFTMTLAPGVGKWGDEKP